MDNLVMIQAGDLIDNSIGVAFGLATLTSAAIGQIVSDVSGTLSSGFVEALADSLGLPRAELTTAQLMQRSVRVSGTAGAVVGVALGCVLGMTTLLFMDLEKAERMKRQRELRTLYTVLMEEGHKLIGAQHCSLFLIDKQQNASGDGEKYLISMGWRGKEPTDAELRRTFAAYDADGSGLIRATELYAALRRIGWTAELQDVEEMMSRVDGRARTAEHALSFEQFSTLMRTALLVDEVRLRMRPGGSRERVITSGKVLNVRDVLSDPRIGDESKRRYKLRGYDVRSLLLAPIFDEDGEVVGLVELVNKEIHESSVDSGGSPRLVRRNSEYGFSKDDERMLKMLCAHCSIFLKHLDLDG